MNLTTQPTSTSAALTCAATRLCRIGPFTALVAVVLIIGLIRGGAPAAASDAAVADLPVGHSVERVVVPGSAQGEERQVEVHLWYPADAGASAGPKAVYKSALHGKELYRDLWDPLSWTIEAEIAREGAAIDTDGGPYPVIVFSHGSTNDPIDYAWTLERIAAGGFVVAAPGHTNNTQDDARIDFINGLATAPPVSRAPLFPCNDERPGPCSRASVPLSMADRASDIRRVLDQLPGWFGGQADVSRAGVMGHSRGTVTALAAAGGSAPWVAPPPPPTPATVNCVPNQPANGLCWPLQREPRIKAVMGMAIGALPIIRGVNLAAIAVPTLLIAGAEDDNSLPANSVFANGQIPAANDKTLLVLDHATHRSFDSTYCAQLQSAGAAFDTNHDGVVSATEAANPGVLADRRIFDRHTVGLIAASAPGFLSGKAVHYCAAQIFTTPVNIEQLVAATPNAEYGCTDAACGVIPPTSGPSTSTCVTVITTIPCTGLDTDAVKQQMTECAVEFFNAKLGLDRDGDGVPDAAVDADGDGAVDACDSHTFGGFLQPVDNPPTINTGRAGRIYPVRFQIRDENGTLVTSLAAVSSIKSKAVSCGSFSGDPSDALETTATGDTSLRFEDNQFVYNWKTPGLAGCYELFVTLADGGAHAASFSLK
jgi:predicted dienelactone hydrolase